MKSHKSSPFLIPRIMSPEWVLMVSSSILAILQPNLSLAMAATTQCFPGLFVFGDSFVDAGNAIAAFPDRFNKTEASPFGITWPGHGADRFSDGRLFGDFTAYAAGGISTSSYFRSVQTSLEFGVNLAAAGSTVLDVHDYPSDSLTDSKFLLTRTPFTLDSQIQWWRRFVIRLKHALTADHPPPKGSILPYEAVNSSLYLVLTGATDYLLQYSSNFPEHRILASVPFIVNRIAKNLETLHVEGAQTILVINLPPLGCTPAFLTMFPGQSHDYDAHGCLKKINTAILRHNQRLFRAVSRLQRRYKSVSSFVYADFYQSSYSIIKDPGHYGFDNTTLLKACCGVGGKYNFDPHSTCGGTWVGGDGVTRNVSVCTDPLQHLTWDGYHFSHAVTRLAALDFFQGKNIHPSNGLLPNNCQANFTTF